MYIVTTGYCGVVLEMLGCVKDALGVIGFDDAHYGRIGWILAVGNHSGTSRVPQRLLATQVCF